LALGEPREIYKTNSSLKAGDFSLKKVSLGDGKLFVEFLAYEQ